MKSIFVVLIGASLGFACLAPAQDAGPVSKVLENRKDRGTLADRIEKVRGDSGKWRDEARLQVSATPGPLPQSKAPLDDWADALDVEKTSLTSGDDTWLIFRTAQLDDNDRVWIEKIERKGGRIEVILNHAVWQGDYSKNFTWYGVVAVNLGKLPAGDYEVDWRVKPLVFLQFEDPKNRRASWPRDEAPAGEQAESKKLGIAFSVGEAVENQ